MKKVLLPVLAMAALTGLSQPVTKDSVGSKLKFASGQTGKHARITYRVINAAHNTWGYDVCLDGRLVIHQTNKPGLAGNEGFATKADAAKVAKLAVDKIKKGMMPPTITVNELKSLKVI